MQSHLKKIAVILPLILVIGGTLTAVMTLKNVGFSEAFWQQWISAFVHSVLVMLPAGAVLSIVVNKLVKATLPNHSAHRQNIVFGLSMALIMEGVMAASTTMSNLGFGGIEPFFMAWVKTYATALPLGMMIACLMSLVVKPRIERFLAA